MKDDEVGESKNEKDPLDLEEWSIFVFFFHILL